MVKFEIKTASNSQFYWVFKGSNGEILCTSETYTTKQSAQHAVSVMKSYAPTAAVFDTTVGSGLSAFYK